MPRLDFGALVRGVKAAGCTGIRRLRRAPARMLVPVRKFFECLCEKTRRVWATTGAPVSKTAFLLVVAYVGYMFIMSLRPTNGLEGFEISCHWKYSACRGLNCYDGDADHPQQICHLVPKQ